MPIKPRKQKDGSVVYDVRVQYGQRRIQRAVPTTLTDAKRVESKMLQDLIQGRFDILQHRENPKFKDYAEYYKTTVTWQKSYRRTITSLCNLVTFFGNKRLTEITGNHFITYRAMRLKAVSPATTNREHACLLRMLNVAADGDEYQISKNPLSGIRFLKERPVANRVLSVDEYHKLLEAAPEYFRRIMFFACHTGMRLMEILNLAFGQIKIWLKRTEIELIETKSGDKEYVPLDHEVIALLTQIADERGVDLHNISTEDKQKHVFTGMLGQPIKSVRKPMVRTFRDAGVEFKPFHTFRHFWTKMMFEAGNDPATIQKIGRWRDFKTMLRYCYTTRAQEHEAVDKLSDHLVKKTAKVFPLRQYNGKPSK